VKAGAAGMFYLPFIRASHHRRMRPGVVAMVVPLARDGRFTVCVNDPRIGKCAYP
jgi:hypothetical protein